MKIKLLNTYLNKDNVVPVLFPFAPICLPINDAGKIAQAHMASAHHYTSIVYSIKDDDFLIFEFGKCIYDGLLAYKQRHGKIFNIRIVLSREEDGSLRMASGNEDNNSLILVKNRREDYLKYYNELYDKYLSKPNYIVHDYEK